MKRRWRQRRWSLLALVSGGLLVALGFGSSGWAGPASDAPPRAYGNLGVMSFNVCGGVCRHGEVTRTATFVAGTATRRGVGVVLLQELCYSQYREVKSLLAERGFSGRFASQTHSPACADDDAKHGTRFGVAVLVRGHISRSVIDRLPTTPGVEHRVLLGVTASVAGRTTYVAGVHLSPSGRAGRQRQLAEVARIVGPQAGRAAIVGGDFNAQPDDPGLQPMFTRFTEVASGRATMPTYARKKIDYVFLSAGQFTDERASTVTTPMSDHRVYLGRAALIRDGG